MASDLENMASSWKLSHDGRQLAALVPFALPVREYEVTVLMYLKGEYPLLRAFVLRAVEQGIRTVSRISAFLGLDSDLVGGGVAEEIQKGNLIYVGDDSLGLTDAGFMQLGNLEEHKLERKRLDIQIDQLTGEVVSYKSVGRIQDFASLAGEFFYEVDAIVSAGDINLGRPDPDTITPERLNELSENSDSKVVEVSSLTKKNGVLKFKPAVLAVYFEDFSRSFGSELILDNKASSRHDLSVNRPGFIESLGLKIDPPSEAPTLYETLVALNVDSTSDGRQLAELARSIPRNEESGSTVQEASPANVKFEQVGLGKFLNESSQPVQLSVYDHPQILSDAFRYSKSRVFLMSPWIRKKVVTRNLLELIDQALRRGVEITIVYGFGDDAESNDETAISELCARSSKGLTFLRHESTHAKLLIVDNTTVHTSFNWLSFRGDKSRTYRMEEGVLTKSEAFASTLYAAMQSKMKIEAKPACK